MLLIDTHAHLSCSEMMQDIEGIVARAEKARITKIVNICTDVMSLQEGLNLAQRYPQIYNAAATTPHDVEKEGESFFSIVERTAASLVALGETGLDYHYVHSPKLTQQHFLNRYLELAQQTGLPLIFHCRDAFSDLFALTRAAGVSSRCLLHCFTGSLEEAREALDLGWLISLSGIITFKKSERLREVLRYLPLDRLVLETDAPYLSPQTRRGLRNEPAFLVETAECLSSILEKSIEEVAATTLQNAEQFFSFSKHKRNV